MKGDEARCISSAEPWNCGLYYPFVECNSLGAAKCLLHLLPLCKHQSSVEQPLLLTLVLKTITTPCQPSCFILCNNLMYIKSEKDPSCCSFLFVNIVLKMESWEYISLGHFLDTKHIALGGCFKSSLCLQWDQNGVHALKLAATEGLHHQSESPCLHVLPRCLKTNGYLASFGSSVFGFVSVLS